MKLGSTAPGGAPDGSTTSFWDKYAKPFKHGPSGWPGLPPTVTELLQQSHIPVVRPSHLSACCCHISNDLAVPDAQQFPLQPTTLSQLSCMQETLDRYNLKIDLLTALKKCQDSGATTDDCMPVLTFSSLPDTQVGYLSHPSYISPAHTAAAARCHRHQHMP